VVLEESRTTTIAGNKSITIVPARNGLTIIIYKSVEGNARTVPSGIKNKGWIYVGFLTGAKMKTSEIFIINTYFCLYWYFNNGAIPGYDNNVLINLCVLGRYCEQCDGDGACEKGWCIESQNLMPLATDKYSGNVF
jgi:hypothetical protein